MDAATIDLIKSIALDAIKIIGPAAITAIATYKIAKSQYEHKLVEIKHSNELEARKSLFDWLKERHEKLKKEYEKLSNALGEAVGFVAGAGVDDSEEIQSAVSFYSDLVAFHSRITPFEIDISLKDMDKHGFKDSAEYKRLAGYRDTVSKLKSQSDFEQLKKDAFYLLEVYSLLLICNQTVIDEQMHGLFSKYIKP